MIYKRHLKEKVEKWLFKKRVILIYGARRVGKTTLCKQILEKYGERGKYINCELSQNQTALNTTNSDSLKTFLGGYKMVVLDEAQKVENIGAVLKIIVDTFPETQVIASGSSSFDLLNQTSEPLTGRMVKFLMYPLALTEIKENYDLFKIEGGFESILRFGLYPDIFNTSEDEAIVKLDELASNYLYKDVLEFERLKKSDFIMNLLRALAFQVGSEVNNNELAKLLNTTHPTIQKYLDLLEKCFVIYRLRPFSRNLRNEINKNFKIFFYDLGVRNALIRNYNSLGLRNDIGALWENFCVIERQKYNQAQNRFVNTYFWRTYTQKEIDYIEEEGGKLTVFEFKWNEKAKIKKPKEFLETYKESSFEVVNKADYHKFLIADNK